MLYKVILGWKGEKIVALDQIHFPTAYLSAL